MWSDSLNTYYIHLFEFEAVLVQFRCVSAEPRLGSASLFYIYYMHYVLLYIYYVTNVANVGNVANSKCQRC